MGGKEREDYKSSRNLQTYYLGHGRPFCKEKMRRENINPELTFHIQV